MASTPRPALASWQSEGWSPFVHRDILNVAPTTLLSGWTMFPKPQTALSPNTFEYGLSLS